MQAATNWSSHLKKHQVFDLFSNDIKKLRFLRFLKIICSTRKNHCMRLILCNIEDKTKHISFTEKMADSFTLPVTMYNKVFRDLSMILSSPEPKAQGELIVYTGRAVVYLAVWL